MTYAIGKVTTMTHVSVRTLHYYDAIDLLNPSYETASGYRLYADGDLELLQQVLFFRSLGFPLAQIKAIVQSPAFDRREALEHTAQHCLNGAGLSRRFWQQLIIALKLWTKEMFDAFDEHALEEHRTKYAEQVKQRWGTTDAYAESQKRTSKYTKEDWARIQKEQSEICEGLAALMDRDPSDPDVQVLVKRYHAYLSSNFYKCSPEILAGLGEGYVGDTRFTATFDKVKPGLAVFLRDAIRVYCTNITRK